MKKFKIIADFEKEEQFLNNMAQKGYYLEKYNSLGVYIFKRIEPQNLCYRIDYRTFSNNAQFENYCTLFQDAGWEHVYGTRRSGSQSFFQSRTRCKQMIYSQIKNQKQDGIDDFQSNASPR